MKRTAIFTALVLAFAISIPLQAQENNEERRIIIHPENYGPYGHIGPIYDEPTPLDKTLQITLKITGPKDEDELVILCATSVYGVSAKKDENNMLSVGGTLRMIRGNEVLLTFDLDTTFEGSSFQGQGSIKIKFGEEKTICKWGGYSVSIAIEPLSD